MKIQILPCSYRKLWKDTQAPGYLCVCVLGETAGKGTEQMVATIKAFHHLLILEPHECKTIKKKKKNLQSMKFPSPLEILTGKHPQVMLKGGEPEWKKLLPPSASSIKLNLNVVIHTAHVRY